MAQQHACPSMFRRVAVRGGALAVWIILSTAEPDKAGTYHGFVRAADGTISTFDPSGSISTHVHPNSINGTGAIAGYYQDNNNRIHGFVRAPDRAITSFDVTGAMGTYAYAINDKGALTGTYNGSAVRGFLRNR